MIVLDYNSLLVALGFCSAGLALTFFVTWFVSRTDRVLRTWAIGVTFIVVSLFMYSDFVDHFSPPVGVIAFAALLTGLTFFWGAGCQFRTGVLPLPTMTVTAVVAIAAMAIPMLLGFDGLSYIAFNIAAMAILIATAWAYWRSRAEAPVLVVTLAGLYAFLGLSFLLCAVVLISHGTWVMHHAPANWAENINLGVSLTSIAGIGALSLGLNQVRLARRHKHDAETDALTGLFNRRALFERAPSLPAPVAIAIFDIDHFKSVNDIHGHQLGDAVLQTFGAILMANLRDGDLAARLGGEEFAIVLPCATTVGAMLVAERVRQNFAGHRFISPAGNFTSSVSAGVSHATEEQSDLAVLLRQADTALYDAKNAGRNRVFHYSDETSFSPPNAPWPAIDGEQAGGRKTKLADFA